MALSFSLDGPPVLLGKRKLSTGTVTFDNSYATGGKAFTPQSVGFASRLDAIMFVGGTGAYHVSWDKTNSKLLVHEITATITGGQSGTVAIGIASDANGAALSKSAANSRTGITGIAHTEVPNGTDLSALTARFVAIGW
jgi:hypothetical protein